MSGPSANTGGPFAWVGGCEYLRRAASLSAQRLPKECGRDSTQNPLGSEQLDHPAKVRLPGPVFAEETPLFVPVGTLDSSPPFQRWESDPDHPLSPGRDGRSLRTSWSRAAKAQPIVWDSVAPDGAGGSQHCCSHR